ncbi:hypothetical protein ACTXT7_017632 [Hymenolepis weldensis]
MTSRAESALTAVKQQLSNVATSSRLNASSETLFDLKTDASQVAVGAVVQGIVNGQIQALPFLWRRQAAAHLEENCFTSIQPSSAPHIILERHQFTSFSDVWLS